MFRSRIIHIINFCVYPTSCYKITNKMSGQNEPHRQWEIALVISDVVVKGGTDPHRFPRHVPEKSTRTRSVHFLQCFQVLGSDSN